MKNGTTKLRDVSEHITVGFVGSMSKYFIDDGVPLLRGQNIKPYQLDLTNLKYIPPEIHKKWKKSSLRADDVVIVRVGYPGTACVIPEGFGDLNAASLVIVRPNPDKLDSRYLCYVINSPWGKATIQGRLVGAAQQVFNTNTAAELEIHLPPLPTQRKIAAILSAYDNLIENNTRRIKILEEMAQALYREWFVKFRFPGHEKVKMVESEMGMMPEGWEVRKLGEVIELAYGKALKSDNRKDGSVLVYGSGGIIGYHNESLVKGPGIIVGRKGNVGSVYWSDYDFFPIDTVYYVKSTILLPYVYYNLQSQNFINNDAAVPGLNRNQAYMLPFLLPKEENLSIFVNFVEDVFKHTKNLKSKNHNLRRTRDLLLPKLISGEVNVENIDVQMPNNGGA